MNASEILVISQHRLAELAALSPPMPSPLTISTGLAKSLLQKSVRRGRIELAVQAAATLLVGDPAALWRRLAYTAAEDTAWGISTRSGSRSPLWGQTLSRAIRRRVGGRQQCRFSTLSSTQVSL